MIQEGVSRPVLTADLQGEEGTRFDPIASVEDSDGLSRGLVCRLLVLDPGGITRDRV